MNGLERRVVAALWSLPGVGIKTIERVRARFADVGALLELPIGRWADEVELTLQAQDALSRLECLAPVADDLERRLKRLEYRIIYPEDDAWPPALRSLAHAPPVLFMLGRGAEGAPRRRVAVVGTRTPETGSCEAVRRLAQDIARAGIGVVSGAAEGIDRVAHLGALDVRGETWAFLGCAIEQMDPGQAVLLGPFREGQGTFFSQFPPGARAEPGTFVQRNQWISGSSEAVVVARAPRKSGALITAESAKEQGRPLLVMPGDPWNTAAAGSNAWLRKGARPCLSVEDVLAALGLVGSFSPRRAPGPRAREPLSESAEQVLAVLSRASTSFDEILPRVAPLSAGATAAALLELELAGEVLQKAGKRYEKVA